MYLSFNQAAGAQWADGILTKLNESQWNPNGIKFDAMSIAPYFGGSIGGCIHVIYLSS